jgi:FixJ family two-component response regulator
MTTRTTGLHHPPLIAVVDDDEAMRDALSELLGVIAMGCRTFARAEAFLANHAPGVFDCLVTDLRMPGMSGLGLLEEIKAREASLPVIVVTSSAEPECREQAIGRGAFAYLVKPVSDEVLIRHLEAALARARTQ